MILGSMAALRQLPLAWPGLQKGLQSTLAFVPALIHELLINMEHIYRDRTPLCMLCTAISFTGYMHAPGQMTYSCMPMHATRLAEDCAATCAHVHAALPQMRITACSTVIRDTQQPMPV